jgi:hypothetical protein
MTMQSKRIEVKLLPGVNLLVIRKKENDRFFYSNDTTFAINIKALSYLLSFLVKGGFLSPKVLEGILEEYYE